MTDKIQMVIGAYGAYNDQTDLLRFGSDWVNFTDYDNWEDIEEELKKYWRMMSLRRC